MNIARACRVGIVWAISLQLLIAPLAGAADISEQIDSSQVTYDESGYAVLADADLMPEPDAIVPTTTSVNTTNDSLDDDVVQDTTNYTYHNAPVLLPAGQDDGQADDDLLLAEVLLISKVQIGAVVDGQASGVHEFIELYNPSSHDVRLDGWRVEFLTEKHDGVSPPTRTLKTLDDVVVEAHGYYVLASPGYLAGLADAFFDGPRHATAGHLATNGTVRLMNGGAVADLVGWGSANQYLGEAARVDSVLPFERCANSSGLIEVLDESNNLIDFMTYDHGGQILLRQSVICSAPEPDEEPESLACEGLRLSEVGANLSDDRQFIELENYTDEPISLAGCQIMTNRSATMSYLLGDETLAAGDHLTIMISETGLRLTKTTAGTVYLLDLSNNEIDSTSYANLKAGTSWALVGDTWHQTYSVTAGSENLYEQFQPCEEGYSRNIETGRCNRMAVLALETACAPDQYRNPETGRCKLIDTASTLSPCREGQYRHPETNRCRNLAVSATTLVPCREGQVRNPATNRCRNVTAASTLQPCQDGWERNPDTNRCRKIANPAAVIDFPVEPIIDTGKGFAAWWALGGITALGAGYGAWEWRRELMAGLRRVGGMMSK